MIAIASWALFDAVTTVPITGPFANLFKPFWEWGLPFMGPNAFVGTLEFGAVLAAIGYSAYTSVAESDSFKYQGDGNPDYSLFD